MVKYVHFESEEEKKRKEQNGYWYEYPNAGGLREWIPSGPRSQQKVQEAQIRARWSAIVSGAGR
ncbi:hypothetical protein KSX_52850 [Ktedonospora formicarum]|uniref:Uncharacterized protein n=1 Tax=Ktedonospora formicarum TaxID=2778364 RepID=A0A8J3I6V2_9CHLR|nr:hypothetical protein KSX_52850 [Ktedonospora formicarum]